jgi:hypothetical protein
MSRKFIIALGMFGLRAEESRKRMESIRIQGDRIKRERK